MATFIVHIYMYICMYVYIYIYMYVCIYAAAVPQAHCPGADH